MEANQEQVKNEEQVNAAEGQAKKDCTCESCKCGTKGGCGCGCGCC